MLRPSFHESIPNNGRTEGAVRDFNAGRWKTLLDNGVKKVGPGQLQTVAVRLLQPGPPVSALICIHPHAGTVPVVFHIENEFQQRLALP